VSSYVKDMSWIGVMLLTFILRKEKAEDILIVCEFVDVFLNNYQECSQREIDYGIELIPYAQPIFNAPYCIAPTELRKLKIQLEELLQKVFIRPSKCFSMGCLVLFVKKNNGTLWLCIVFRELNMITIKTNTHHPK